MSTSQIETPQVDFVAGTTWSPRGGWLALVERQRDGEYDGRAFEGSTVWRSKATAQAVAQRAADGLAQRNRGAFQ